LGQVQSAQIYGAVVDELTEEQASGVLIPVPDSNDQERQAKSED
jgi:hypothetical protein